MIHGERPRQVLVTGSTGFLGRALTERLRAEGHRVTALGRNEQALASVLGEHYSGGSAAFRYVDLRDRAAVIAACAGQEIVYHLGALTAPWGSWKDFRETNVAGTASVISGCRTHHVQRLIHVSSPSVIFAQGDHFDLNDDTPYPRRSSSRYAYSKQLAEVLVRRAIEHGLEAVIIRPRAVFGPGDTTLFPRLLRAARLGRLPRIGAGDNVTDLTYIDDVVHALLLAMNAEHASGRVLTITDGQPVALWPLLDQVLATQGLQTSERAISLPVALTAAWALEAIWRIGRLAGEPPVTRYSVGLLGYSQTFAISQARQALGYTPIVGMDEGIARTLASLQNENTPQQSPDGEPLPGAVTSRLNRNWTEPLFTDVIVSCEVLAAGYCMQSAHLMQQGAARHPVAIPATFALLRHPQHGLILFDTGYAPRSITLTRQMPFALYSTLLPITIKEEWSAVAQLARRGISADDIRYVILSHFHADHLGGVRDFPHATFIAARGSYRRVQNRKSWDALRLAFVPSLLPEDIDNRLRLLPISREGRVIKTTETASESSLVSTPWSVFPETIDLFGDGSLRVVPLPGHAAGQIGVLVQTAARQWTLLAADGSWTSQAYRTRSMPSRLSAPLQDSWGATKRTLGRLHAVWRSEPDVAIVPCHCPELHAELLESMKIPASLRWSR